MGFGKFFTSLLADSLSLESEWQQIPCTLLHILAYLNNAVVWMVTACSWIFNFSGRFTKPLVIASSALITIGIPITFMFHSFFLVLQQGLSTYLSFCLLWFSLGGLLRQQNLLFGRFSFFLLTITRSGGARGVMVIIVGNGHGDTSSNPGRGWLHFT